MDADPGAGPGGPLDGGLVSDLARDAGALLASPWGLAAAALFGALWGSFFNVCIARVPRGESVVRPGSRCFSCGAPVRAFDNVPILSYFLLRGRCRSCGARFSIRYALVEALVALLSALVYWKAVLGDPGEPLGLRLVRYVVYFAFVGVLVVLAFIDLDTKRLPDVITLPSVVVFFLAGFAVHEVPWTARAIGAAAGYLGVRIIADGYYYLTGREGLGLGDGKLLAVVGALLGWRALPPVIFAASFLGVLVSVPILLATRGRAPGPATPPAEARPAEATQADGGEAAEDAPSIRRAEVPFGPFLALSALGYLFFSGPIWGAIERLVGG